jgi:hypothetical protein
MDGRATLIRRSMLLTVAVMRAYLWFCPNADLNVGAYNIHHLFTGALLMSAAGIAASLDLRRAARDACAVAFGIGLALTLDEWVYLIVTDGTNAMYWSTPSVIGAIVAIAAAWVCLSFVHGPTADH